MAVWFVRVTVFLVLICSLPYVLPDIVDVKNSALRKPAIQSSTYRDNVEVFGARLANDGSPQTCAKTQWSWTLFWRVDLMESAAIAGANITLRWEYFGSVDNRFLYQVELQVGNENIPLADSCGTEVLLLDRPNEYSVEIVCQNATFGRFVTINVTPSYAGTVTTGSPQLTLCDVKVFTIGTESSSVEAGSSGGNDALAMVASSHTTEVITEDDPQGSKLTYLHSDGSSTESNVTHSLSDRGSRTTTPKRKVFREIVTKTKIERLLREMKTPSSSTTPRREGTLSDDDDHNHAMPTPNLEITSDEGALALEVMALKDDMNAKLQLMQHYVVFSSVAVGILLLLGFSIGIFLIWRMTSSSATGEIQHGPSQEFSFKSPPSPSPPVALKTLHRPGTFNQRVKEFPRDSVPKEVRNEAYVARGLMF